MTLGIREIDGTLSDKEVHAMLISIKEWWDADNHLKNKDSEGPPVHSEVMTISNKHFRSQVLRSSTEGVSQLTLLNEFGKTKISNQKIPYKVKIKIGRLIERWLSKRNTYRLLPLAHSLASSLCR